MCKEDMSTVHPTQTSSSSLCLNADEERKKNQHVHNTHAQPKPATHGSREKGKPAQKHKSKYVLSYAVVFHPAKRSGGWCVWHPVVVGR